MNLTEDQKTYLERAQREGYLLLHEYDTETHPDLELEWRAWCEENSAPFVKIEICERGATVSYSLLRFPVVTDLTEAEIDELQSFAFHARGSEIAECYASSGRFGFIELSDAEHIAHRIVEFCRAGIRHLHSGATVPRYEPAPQEKKA